MHSAKAAQVAIAGLVSGIGLMASLTLAPAAGAPASLAGQEPGAARPSPTAAQRVVPQATSSPTQPVEPSSSASVPDVAVTPTPTAAGSAPAAGPDKPSSTLTVVAIVVALMISLGAGTIALFRR